MGKRYRLFALTHGTIVVFAMLLCCCVAIVLPLCCHVGDLFFRSCVVTMRCSCMFMVEGEGKMHVGIMYLRYRGCCLCRKMVVSLPPTFVAPQCTHPGQAEGGVTTARAIEGRVGRRGGE